MGKSAVSVSNSMGKSMVASGIGLSLFDRPLDRQNRDAVCTYLRDLPHKIIAVWICARPVNGISDDYGYEHWCVKIQAPPSLISIDFLESDGKGKFGLSITTAMMAELQDFFNVLCTDKHWSTTKKMENCFECDTVTINE